MKSTPLFEMEDVSGTPYKYNASGIPYKYNVAVMDTSEGSLTHSPLTHSPTHPLTQPLTHKSNGMPSPL